MISAKPMAMVAMLALAGGAAAQDKGDENRIAELIEGLKDASSRHGAKIERLRMGSRPAGLLVDALGADEGSLSQPYQAWIGWKEVILDVITLMGKDAVNVFEELGDSIRHLPEELTPKWLHAWGEVALWTFAGSVRVSGSGRGTRISNTVSFTRDGVKGEFSFFGSERPDQGFLRRAATRLSVRQDPSLHQVNLFLDSARSEALEAGLDLAGNFGQEAKESLPRIEAILLGGPVGPVVYRDLIRFKAAQAMVAIAPDDPRSSGAYGYLAAHHYDPRVRSKSALSAGYFGSAGESSVPFLLTALSDVDEIVVHEAITALGMIGPAAKDAIPTLEKLTEHDDPQIAERAKAALRQVRGR